MISTKGQLVMHVDQPEIIKTVIPHALLREINGKSLLVVPHAADEVKALRNLGLSPPVLDLQHFNYPGRFKPFEHQRKCVEFLVVTRRGFNLSDAGVGKTAATLWAYEYLRRQGKVMRMLIAAPLSVLSVWEEEHFNILPHRSFCKITGSKDKRKQLLEAGSDIVVTNHDGLTTIASDIKKAKFDLIVLDEATVYKNAQTRRYKTLKDTIKEVPYLWLLTGTPVTKAPTDAYALIKLVDPTKYSGSFTSFKEHTMTRINEFKWVPKRDSTEFVYKHMQPAIRFKKEDCLDLPPITYVNRTCELTPQQAKAFKDMKEKYIMEKQAHETPGYAEVTGEKITAANAAVKLLKLIQIACGVVKDNDQERYDLDASTRFDTLEEIVDEVGGKIIVFVPFIGVMDAVVDFLTKKGWSVGLVNGSVSEKKRAQIFENFQKGDLEVLVAHPKTAAHGLNLTSSSTVVWYGPIFSAETYIQGNSRVNRAGQKHKMTIYHIISTPLEAALFRALWTNVNMGNAILDMYKEVAYG